MKILETYRNTIHDKDGPGLVLITDAMPGWNQEQWRAMLAAEGAKPDPQPWRPSFLLVFGTEPITGQKFPENHRWFADAATAQVIARRYGNGQTREVEFNPYLDHKALEFQLLDERWVNAGVIAGYFENNPEDEAPGVADRSIRAVLGI